MAEVFQVIRARQRALTAILPHPGNRKVLVPARASVPESAVFTLDIETDAADLFGFRTSDFGAISLPDEMLSGEEMVQFFTNNSNNFFQVQYSNLAQPTLLGYLLSDSLDAFAEVDTLAWDAGQDRYRQVVGGAARTARWVAALGTTITVKLQAIGLSSTKPALLFAGDTFISLPDVSVIKNSGTARISYTATMDAYGGVTRFVWGDDAALNQTGWLATEVYRPNRGGVGASLSGVGVLAEGVAFDCAEVWGPAGTFTVTVAQLGSNTPSTSFGTTDMSGPWQIGGRDSSPGGRWVGVLKDFRVMNDSGQVIHHWPINDNASDGGKIRDIVGGQDGILTLGAGAWV